MEAVQIVQGFYWVHTQVNDWISLKSIPKYTQLKPVHLNPATDLGPTNVGNIQNPLSLCGHM